MTERFPDLEIYILKAEPANVEQWLRDTFNQVDCQKSTDSHNHWRVDDMDVFLNAGAEKNFASLHGSGIRSPLQRQWLVRKRSRRR